jgi:cytoskeletal protein CcmA (bactofilin family)
LLRIDGKFQGTFVGHGDVIVGPLGCIVGDVIVVRRIVVEGGRVVGKIVADEVLLMDRSVIKGDITCKLLAIEGPNVAISGRTNVHPQVGV